MFANVAIILFVYDLDIFKVHSEFEVLSVLCFGIDFFVLFAPYERFHIFS